MKKIVNEENYDDNIVLKSFFQNLLPDYAIEDISLTSMLNSFAFSMIDILIVIDDINHLANINDLLKSNGFVFCGDLGEEGRFVYHQTNDHLPLCQVFICLNDSPALIKQRAFTKYLLNNPKQLAKYHNLHQQALKGSGDDYLKTKSEFILDVLKHLDLPIKKYEQMRPDYNNSIVNLVNSIKKHFMKESSYPTLPIVDDAIKNANHIALIILDGMGKNIMDENLSADGFFRQNIKSYLSSVCPPTTVAATTSLLSALPPGETGWLGWHQYFPKYEHHIKMFTGIDFYTEEEVTKEYLHDVAYEIIINDQHDVAYNELYPAFKKDGFANFTLMSEEILSIMKNNDKSYTYAYWDQPDNAIHDFGVKNSTVKGIVTELELVIQDMQSRLPKDAVVIVVADHGLIDVKTISLDKFPEIMKYFIRLPGLEERCSALYVNEQKEFEKVFNLYFSSYFDLIKTSDFLEQGYFGPKYDKALPYLGDFIALAKHQYCLSTDKSGFHFKGAHAGSTKEEMLVPLIIISKPEINL